MISATVDRSAFLAICKDLGEDAMEAIVTEFPDAFSGALRIGDVPPKPPAKPRERKARPVADDVTAKVLVAIRSKPFDAWAPQAIMSAAGLTRGATSAALKALVDAGMLTTTGKARGTKYAVAGAAS